MSDMKISFHAVSMTPTFLTHNWARWQISMISFIKDNDQSLLPSTEKADVQVILSYN